MILLIFCRGEVLLFGGVVINDRFAALGSAAADTPFATPWPPLSPPLSPPSRHPVAIPRHPLATQSRDAGDGTRLWSRSLAKLHSSACTALYSGGVEANRGALRGARSEPRLDAFRKAERKALLVMQREVGRATLLDRFTHHQANNQIQPKLAWSYHISRNFHNSFFSPVLNMLLLN